VLKRDDAVLLVIDVQGKLAQLMHDKAGLFKNLAIMVGGAQILSVPILVTEQYPQGMGSTIPELTGLIPDITPISKTSFSCCGEAGFTAALESLKRHQALLTGIEAHICVQQTAQDLLHSGYEVHVVGDAVSSRTAENKRVGIEKMRDAGATITSTEAALFELLKAAGGPEFKRVLELVK